MYIQLDNYVFWIIVKFKMLNECVQIPGNQIDIDLQSHQIRVCPTEQECWIGQHLRSDTKNMGPVTKRPNISYPLWHKLMWGPLFYLNFVTPTISILVPPIHIYQPNLFYINSKLLNFLTLPRLSSRSFTYSFPKYHSAISRHRDKHGPNLMPFQKSYT